MPVTPEDLAIMSHSTLWKGLHQGKVNNFTVSDGEKPTTKKKKSKKTKARDRNPCILLNLKTRLAFLRSSHPRDRNSQLLASFLENFHGHIIAHPSIPSPTLEPALSDRLFLNVYKSDL